MHAIVSTPRYKKEKEVGRTLVAGSSRQSLFQDLETQAYYNSLCPAFLTLFNVLSTKTAGNEKFVDQEGREEIGLGCNRYPRSTHDPSQRTVILHQNSRFLNFNKYRTNSLINFKISIILV